MVEREALEKQAQERLGTLGYVVRRPRAAFDAPPVQASGSELWFLVDGPGLNGYAMTAREIHEFASGRDVSRRTGNPCPRCGVELLERVEWLARARASDNRLRRVRCCTACDWRATL